MTKELFINNTLVELDDKTSIDLQYKSFLFVGISTLSSPRSWTVSLPPSLRNLALINGVSSGDGASDFPYTSYTVDYYQDSFRIIDGGKAIFNGYKNGRIEFVFTFGKAFEAIKLMTEKKLTELTEGAGDFLEWNRSLNFNTMDDVLSNPDCFGWVNWYNFTNNDRTYTTHADIPFSVTHPTVLAS